MGKHKRLDEIFRKRLSNASKIFAHHVYRSGSVHATRMELSKLFGWDLEKVDRTVKELKQANVLSVSSGSTGRVYSIASPANSTIFAHH